jgi:DNA-binding MarR family transcriptional regulator
MGGPPIISGMVLSLPLSVLLSQVLIALAWEYQQAGDGEDRVPPLPLWSNLLRFVDDESVALRDVPRLARLSKRAIRVLVASAEERWGFVAVEAAPALRGGRIVRLTDRGRRAREAGRSGLAVVEQRWRTAFGEARIEALRTSLEAVVRQLDLELPHYPLGYGPADNSMTGGRAVYERPGPPRIPAHGRDWSPVLRHERDTLAGLPLSALLSQVLVAFAIDYEREAFDSMATAANVLRLMGDEGVPLRQLPPGAAVTGTGKSGLERHGKLVVERDPTNPRRKLARLTVKARRTRDAYAPLIADIERDWQARYGQELIHTLRAALEPIASELGTTLAHFPTVEWIGGFFTEVSRPVDQ